MKYIKLLKTGENYDDFIRSDKAGFPNVVVYHKSHESYGALDRKIVLCKIDPTPDSDSTPDTSVKIINFYINNTQYSCEEGMTFYDWALSEYFDSSCALNSMSGNLRDFIIEFSISPGDSAHIYWGAGAPINPSINTDTIIQPISYMPDTSVFQ